MRWASYREVLLLVWDAVAAVFTNDIWRDKVVKRSMNKLEEMEKILDEEQQ